ncbi:hypothetical protein L226DRAFT_69709 [Lentinus tigrinus ALCF2SS1-7]|uniref:uncharacterized protein n=1 Tax=Lentinus tigrinus ALCF2SS1-7 TaxID=1328758 RepID=UPI001165E39B|nr:hypothetical protein L226DRAFT_69709 [Lentinus tigrinus ALCF2SS1-7]
MPTTWYLFHHTRPPDMFAVYHPTRPPDTSPARGHGPSLYGRPSPGFRFSCAVPTLLYRSPLHGGHFPGRRSFKLLGIVSPRCAPIPLELSPLLIVIRHVSQPRPSEAPMSSRPSARSSRQKHETTTIECLKALTSMSARGARTRGLSSLLSLHLSLSISLSISLSHLSPIFKFHLASRLCLRFAYAYNCHGWSPSSTSRSRDVPRTPTSVATNCARS